MKNKAKTVIWIVTAILLLVITVGVIMGLRKGIFSSQDAFVEFIEATGVFAPLVFVVIETLSVIILILPCALGYPVSVAAFGPFWGFILNAVSTVLGSIIIFLIVRIWGKPLVDALVSKRNYTKYEKFIEKTPLFEKLLAIMLLLPFFPDNMLCYIAGLTKMQYKRFCIIVLLFKPWKILFYTYGSQFFLDRFGHLWTQAMTMINL